MEVIDACGKSCPLPIVLLSRAVKAARVGDQIQVLADDRAFPEDVKAWCAKTGHELLDLSRSDAGQFRAHVVRAK